MRVPFACRFLWTLALTGPLLVSALACGASLSPAPATSDAQPSTIEATAPAGDDRRRASSPAARATPPEGAVEARPASCIPERAPQQATVVRVIDGDTIDVVLDGARRRVRYIGVNTPEREQPLYSEATDANVRLLSAGAVLLYRDMSETDRYGRLLRYVVAGGRFVNLELVKAGYAQAMTVPPDVACSQLFVQAEREAREAGVGLWATSPPPSSGGAARQFPSAAAGGGCDPSYPDLCIPPPPPDLDCRDVPQRWFRVLPPDPHRLDSDGDGTGCES